MSSEDAIARIHPPGIVVLGMHRGGTSLAAQLVARWGAYANERDLVGPDSSNPEGYWELTHLVSFNEELLSVVESSWNVPPRDSHREILESMAEDPVFRDRALSLLEIMRAEQRPWFWKDPRLCLLLPFWKKLWGPVAYVIATRDPADIAQSLATRDGLSVLTAFRLWHRYFSEILRDDDVRTGGFFASYDFFCEHPQEACLCLCRFLDRQCNGMASFMRDEIETSDCGQKLDLMARSIRSDLWRSRARPFLENPLATRSQRALYEATLQVARYWHGMAPLDPSWREDLAAADRTLRLTAPDLCQLFWRNSESIYQEMRSVRTPVRRIASLQSVQLNLPSSQIQDRLFLRLDVSRHPGFLNLVSLAVQSAAGEAVWQWDGRRESLEWNQVRFCAVSRALPVCLLRLEGDDPWMEIALDCASSSRLSDGGTVTMEARYLTTADVLLEIAGGITAEIESLRNQLNEIRSLAVEECEG